jgi:transcription elongation factor Elf1
MEMHSFGTCPICGQGQVVAVKNPATQQLLVMCDDCESQWRTPDAARSYENALTDEVRDVEPATTEEIKLAGWFSLSK